MLYGEAMRRVEEGEGCPALLEGIGTVMGVYGVEVMMSLLRAAEFLGRCVQVPCKSCRGMGGF